MTSAPSPYLIPSQMYYPSQPRSARQTGGPRGRPFVFGTPPDYAPRSPPEELIRRGRQRARSLSVGRTAASGNDEGLRGYSTGRNLGPAVPRPPNPIDFAYSASNPYRHSRSVSQPRSRHHHHPHRPRNPTSSRAVSPSRPTPSRRRSHSLPPPQAAYNQSYYPSTSASALAPFQQTTGTHSSRRTRATSGIMPIAYGAQQMVAPAVEPRHRPKPGFLSRLFGSKVKDESRTSVVRSPRVVQPVQPYVGYGPSAPRTHAIQGPATAQMYSPLPVTPIPIPRTAHRHRRRRRSLSRVFRL